MAASSAAVQSPRIMTDAELQAANERKMMETVAQRASFYRANPHRFAKDYLHLDLYIFQQIILVLISLSTNFLFLASRGIGKTFILAVFCVIRCILYPGSLVVVTAKTRGQAYEVIDKIEKILIPKSALLRSEINFKRSAFNLQKAEVVFYNTSCIRVVTANDNSRHFRANVLLVDEYRMIPLDTLNTVLREFLVGSRDAGYLRKPQYRHLAERNMELYASSCWYTSHWSYQLAQDYLNNMMTEGKKYIICGLPYQLAVREGIQSKEAIEDKMTESTFSAVKFQMESEALWFSDTDGGLYSYSDISRTCKIDYPMFPSSVTELIRDQKIMIPPKKSGEYRILSADIAVMASSGSKSNNDATSLFINQMTPTKSGRYLNNIVYTENYEGAHTEDQALIIRKMFEEYDCDYIAIDARGVGWGVVDLLLRDQVDYATGQIYPALSCCNDDDIAARCPNPRAQKAIWVIKGNAQFNSDCALGLREAFRQGTIRLLKQEYDCEEQLYAIKGWDKLSPAEQLELRMPYVNTSLLVNELINLEYEAKDSGIKVHEKSGMRKDRYSSLSYNLYVARELERQLQKPKRTVDDAGIVRFRAPEIRSFNTGRRR